MLDKTGEVGVLFSRDKKKYEKITAVACFLKKKWASNTYELLSCEKNKSIQLSSRGLQQKDLSPLLLLNTNDGGYVSPLQLQSSINSCKASLPPFADPCFPSFSDNNAVQDQVILRCHRTQSFSLQLFLLSSVPVRCVRSFDGYFAFTHPHS